MLITSFALLTAVALRVRGSPLPALLAGRQISNTPDCGSRCLAQKILEWQCESFWAGYYLRTVLRLGSLTFDSGRSSRWVVLVVVRLCLSVRCTHLHRSIRSLCPRSLRELLPALSDSAAVEMQSNLFRTDAQASCLWSVK